MSYNYNYMAPKPMLLFVKCNVLLHEPNMPSHLCESKLIHVATVPNIHICGIYASYGFRPVLVNVTNSKMESCI